MTVLDRGKIGAVRARTPNHRISRFVDQPQNHTLRLEKTSNRAQHLANEFLRRRRGRKNIQALDQGFDLAPRDLLGSAQRLFC